MKGCKCSVLIISICFTFSLAAQNRLQLEEERMQVIESIEVTDSLIEASESNRQKGLATLLALRGQIAQRNALLENIKLSILAAELEIEHNQLSIDSLSEKVKVIEDQYALMLRSKYVNKLKGSKWISILSASNFNEAFLRWNYHRQFEAYRSSKIDELAKLRKTLLEKNEEIKSFALESSALIRQEQLQNSEQKLRIEQQNTLLNDLQKDRSILQSQLLAIKQSRESLNKAIESKVIGELRGSDQQTEDVEKREDRLTIVEGKIILPVTNGYLEDLPSSNNSSLKTASIYAFEGADVISIASGEVISVEDVDGYGKMLILQHGEYYSIYANMLDVIVNKGDQVSKNTILGNVDKEKNTLHFELWRDKVRLNAEAWLRK